MNTPLATADARLRTSGARLSAREGFRALAPDSRRALVRGEVARLLESAPAYGSLSPRDRQEMEDGLTRVGEVLADPGFLEQEGDPETPAAETLQEFRDRIAGSGPIASVMEQGTGEDFVAGGAREGTRAFKDLVDAVDFPQFVSGLIQGVFQAIVSSSIQQMQAYQELVSAVVKSAAQFGQESYPDAAAMQFIAGQFPQALRMSMDDEAPALVLTDSGEITPAIAAQLGVEAGADPSDEETLAQMLVAAKTTLGRQRQQMMSTMILMGLNRIVVTNGRINAKVLFDINTSDVASQQSSTTREEETAASVGYSGWGAHASYDHRTSVKSTQDSSSESKTEMNAQLSGDVTIAFKSETFPLERLAGTGALGIINTKAAPEDGENAA